MVVTDQGVKAEAVLDAINGTLDNMTDYGNFLIADWHSSGRLLENGGKLTVSS